MSKELIACIVEGGAERAIIDLLLDNCCLCFDREDLLDADLLLDKAARNAKTFQRRYLSRGYSLPIKVYRILDNPKSDRFVLDEMYREKVSVINVVTSPEIEMLIIYAEGAYEDYLKKRMKPSDYCKSVLKMPRVKEYEYVKDYFSDIDKLLGALEEYKRCTKKRKGELTIFDLVKEK